MTVLYCTQCGTRLPERSIFCPECGTRVESAAARPAPAVPTFPTVPAVKRQPVPSVSAVKRQPVPSVRSTSLRRRSTPLPLVLLAALLVVSAIVAFAVVRPNQNDLVVAPCVAGEDCAATAAPAGATIPDVHNEDDIPYPDAPRVELADAKAQFDAGQVLFVDVRDAEAYAAAHIPESMSLPLAGLESTIPPLPKETWIVTYCT